MHATVYAHEQSCQSAYAHQSAHVYSIQYVLAYTMHVSNEVAVMML
jgi:hypothetical protein